MPQEFGSTPLELNDMLNVNVERDCAHVFSAIKRSNLAAELERAMEALPRNVESVLAEYRPMDEPDLAATAARLRERLNNIADTLRTKPPPVAPFGHVRSPLWHPDIEKIRRGEIKGRNALQVVLELFPEAKFHGSKNRDIATFEPRVPERLNLKIEDGEPVFHDRGYVWVTPSPDVAIFCAALRGRGPAGWRSEVDAQGMMKYVFGAAPETIARALDANEPPGHVYVFLDDFEIDPNISGEYRSDHAIVPWLSIDVTGHDLWPPVELLPVTVNMADPRYTDDGAQKDVAPDPNVWRAPPFMDRRVLYRDIEVARRTFGKDYVLSKWTRRAEKVERVARKHGIARLVPFVARAHSESAFEMTIEEKRVLFVNARSGFAIQEVMRLVSPRQ